MTARAFLRLQKNKMASGLRGAAFMNDVHFPVLVADQLVSEVPRVGDGRRKQDELGSAPIKSADPLKTSENLRHVTPEHSPIGVHFVDDHEPQFLPKGFPFSVIGQQGIMEHIRIGEQDVRMIPANLGALVGSRISVINRGSEERSVVPGADRFEEDVESFQLISAEGLDRKKIEGPLLGILEERFRNGKVVDERFTACGWRGHHDVTPRADPFEGPRLVFVEAGYAEFAKGLLQNSGKRLLQRSVACLLGGKNSVMCDFEPAPPMFEQHLQKSLNHLMGNLCWVLMSMAPKESNEEP
jgi:hypothetical protein